MKSPRSDVVLRRFMAGDSIHTIVGSVFRSDPTLRSEDLVVIRVRVESALRRAFAKNRKRGKR
jgi:hypothetical protein